MGKTLKERARESAMKMQEEKRRLDLLQREKEDQARQLAANLPGVDLKAARKLLEGTQYLAKSSVAERGQPASGGGGGKRRKKSKRRKSKRRKSKRRKYTKKRKYTKRRR